MAASLKNQIATLQRKLAKTQLNGPSSNSASRANMPSGSTRAKRRRNRRNASGGSVGARYIAPVVVDVNPKRTSRPRGNISPAGSMRIRRRELLTALNGQDKNYWLISPSKTNTTYSLSWLPGLAANFDRYKVHSLKFVYRPSVGTTTAGTVMMGIDWDSRGWTSMTSTNANYMKYIAASTPMIETPAWQAATLVCPPSKLMSRKEYMIWEQAEKNSWVVKEEDKCNVSPGSLVFMSTVASGECGHIWVEYDISMYGTSVLQQS